MDQLDIDDNINFQMQLAMKVAGSAAAIFSSESDNERSNNSES